MWGRSGLWCSSGLRCLWALRCWFLTTCRRFLGGSLCENRVGTALAYNILDSRAIRVIQVHLRLIVVLKSKSMKFQYSQQTFRLRMRHFISLKWGGRSALMPLLILMYLSFNHHWSNKISLLEQRRIKRDDWLKWFINKCNTYTYMHHTH